VFETVQAYKCLCKPGVLDSVQACKCLCLSLLITSEAGFALKIGMNDATLKVAYIHITAWMDRILNPSREENFLFSQTYQTVSDHPPTPPLSLLFNWYRGSFWGINQPEREVYHSNSSSADVKYDCNYTSCPSTCLHAADSDNFICYTFTFLIVCR
jgi:hypothetical protein